MKLLTLNTHSLVDGDAQKKIKTLSEVILKENFDIIALQEVNQSTDASLYKKELLKEMNYVQSDSDAVIKSDNYALSIVSQLKNNGLNYNWSWVPINLSYDKYDEGISILSKYEILDVKQFYISAIQDFYNYKSRKVLGIKIKYNDKFIWFYSVHMGWWNDSDDLFINQWNKFMNEIENEKQQLIYLMGDFNNPADVHDEGYDHILNDNWYDTYVLSKFKDDGITVADIIDGWRDKKDIDKMRIDFIFKNNNATVQNSNVIFNNFNYPIVSDHFGVSVTDDSI